MINCEGNCNSCNTECSAKCPICGRTAVKVPLTTVKNLLKEYIDDKDYEFYVCLNRKCETSYFNKIHVYDNSELTVPIWFKQDPKDMIVCYCHNITLKDIIDIVKKEKLTTKEEIIISLGKDISKKDCLNNNPLGKECDQLFENAILYAKGDEN